MRSWSLNICGVRNDIGIRIYGIRSFSSRAERGLAAERVRPAGAVRSLSAVRVTIKTAERTRVYELLGRRSRRKPSRRDNVTEFIVVVVSAVAPFHDVVGGGTGTRTKMTMETRTKKSAVAGERPIESRGPARSSPRRSGRGERPLG